MIKIFSDTSLENAVEDANNYEKATGQQIAQFHLDSVATNETRYYRLIVVYKGPCGCSA